jgi:hypothetical protein
MSVAFEGNAYLDASVIVNTTIGNSSIKTSSLDMLDSFGNYQNITNVASPVNPHDVVIKEYIDTFTNNQTIVLTGTNGTLISSILYGSYIITIKNIVNNGPSAIYNLSKKNSSVLPHRIRINSCPDIASSTYLNVTWDISSGIFLSKSTGSFDGSYDIKLT